MQQLNRNSDLVQELFSKEHRKLTEFVTQFAKYVDADQALLYLERWQVNACATLADHFPVKQLEAVWLNQQFELELDEQVKRLIVLFFDVLDQWEATITG